MIYYCISDIHGCLFAFQNALDIITNHLSEENTALILLGDYIHGGKENASVLDKIMELQNRYGSGKVIALLGNHEELVCEGMTSVDACGVGSGDDDRYVNWLCGLPRYHVAGKTIFVHAGIDEEAEDLWKYGPWTISLRKNILPKQDTFSKITKSLPDISALLRSLGIRTFTGSILTEVLTIILMQIRWRLVF